MPNGSYQGVQQTTLADAHQVRHVGGVDRTEQLDPIGDAELLGDSQELHGVGIVAEQSLAAVRRR